MKRIEQALFAALTLSLTAFAAEEKKANKQNAQKTPGVYYCAVGASSLAADAALINALKRGPTNEELFHKGAKDLQRDLFGRIHASPKDLEKNPSLVNNRIQNAKRRVDILKEERAAIVKKAQLEGGRFFNKDLGRAFNPKEKKRLKEIAEELAVQEQRMAHMPSVDELEGANKLVKETGVAAKASRPTLKQEFARVKTTFGTKTGKLGALVGFSVLSKAVFVATMAADGKKIVDAACVPPESIPANVGAKLTKVVISPDPKKDPTAKHVEVKAVAPTPKVVEQVPAAPVATPEHAPEAQAPVHHAAAPKPAPASDAPAAPAAPALVSPQTKVNASQEARDTFFDDVDPNGDTIGL